VVGICQTLGNKLFKILSIEGEDLVEDESY
jgi:hypothetical protein